MSQWTCLGTCSSRHVPSTGTCGFWHRDMWYMGGEKYAYLIIFVLFKTSLLDKNQHFFSVFLTNWTFWYVKLLFLKQKNKTFSHKSIQYLLCISFGFCLVYSIFLTLYIRAKRNWQLEFKWKYKIPFFFSFFIWPYVSNLCVFSISAAYNDLPGNYTFFCSVYKLKCFCSVNM